jgi:hypothetical protein
MRERREWACSMTARTRQVPAGVNRDLHKPARETAIARAKSVHRGREYTRQAGNLLVLLRLEEGISYPPGRWNSQYSRLHKREPSKMGQMGFLGHFSIEL